MASLSRAIGCKKISVKEEIDEQPGSPLTQDEKAAVHPHATRKCQVKFEHIEVPERPVQVKLEHIEVPEHPVQVKFEHIEVPGRPVQVKLEHIEVPERPVQNVDFVVKMEHDKKVDRSKWSVQETTLLVEEMNRSYRDYYVQSAMGRKHNVPCRTLGKGFRIPTRTGRQCRSKVQRIIKKDISLMEKLGVHRACARHWNTIQKRRKNE